MRSQASCRACACPPFPCHLSAIWQSQAMARHPPSPSCDTRRASRERARTASQHLEFRIEAFLDRGLVQADADARRIGHGQEAFGVELHRIAQLGEGLFLI